MPTAAGWVNRDDHFEWMLAGDASDRLLHSRLLDLAQWSEQHLRTPRAELFDGEPRAVL